MTSVLLGSVARQTVTDDVRGTMADHLSDAIGEPDAEAQQIIDAIESYLRSDRDPLVITRGLRHIQQHAEHAWDASVDQAKRWPDGSHRHTFQQITDATGDALSTLSGRIRAHRARARGERPRRPIDPRRSP